MNPLGVSVIFVICSIMLSFLKHMFFAPSEPTSSNAKFNKIFQLTNNKIQNEPTYYKSLYQAFYQLKMEDIDKYSSKLLGKEQFNEIIHMNPLKNWEMSFICPPDFLILAVSGVTINESGWAKSTNSFYIYKLPLMDKIEEITIDGRILLQKQCEKSTRNNKYELKFLSKNGPAIISIDQNQKIRVQHINFSQTTNRYSGTQIFDFDNKCLAYWQPQQLWSVKLQFYVQNSSQIFEQDRIQQKIRKQTIQLQINILSIEVDKNKSYNETQSLNVYQIQVNSKFEGTYITIIYQYHSMNSSNKSIIVSSFLVTLQHIKLLTRIVIHTQNVNSIPILLICSHYINQYNQTHDLSCLLHRADYGKTNFINVFDIFNTTAQPVYNLSNKQKEYNYEHYTNYIDQQQLSDLYVVEEDDDFTWIIDSILSEEQPTIKQTHYWKMLNFAFEISSHSSLKIIKPSLPDPILYYSKGDEHILFSFNLKMAQGQDEQIEASYYTLQPPTFQEEDDKHLRQIFWIKDENLIVVVWNGGIEAYDYQLYEFPQNSSEGVSMSIIFPFIELFATVFCLMRIVWGND